MGKLPYLPTCTKFILRLQRTTTDWNPSDIPEGAILTAEELNNLRSESKICIPFGSRPFPPTRWTKSWKLKADQWRTLGTTSSLFHSFVFGIRSTMMTDALRTAEVGCNPFPDIGCHHCFISYYIGGEGGPILHHMQNYSMDYASFPSYRFLQINIWHSSCSISATYGPVHSWWTFLSNAWRHVTAIPTNFRLVSLPILLLTCLISQGKLEETISPRLQDRKLRALMLREGCPEAIKNCSGHFSKFLDPQVRNTLLTDISRFLALEEDITSPLLIEREDDSYPGGPYKALRSISRVRAQSAGG